MVNSVSRSLSLCQGLTRDLPRIVGGMLCRLVSGAPNVFGI